LDAPPDTPQTNGRAALLWDDSAFCQRVQEAAERLGKSVTQIMVEAGCARDYLAKPARSGRNTDAVLRIARTLQVPYSDLIGDLGDEIAALDRRAKEIHDRELEKLAVISSVAAHLQVALGHVALPGVDSFDIIRGVIEMLEESTGVAARHKNPKRERRSD